MTIDSTKIEAHDKSVPCKDIIQYGNADDWDIKNDTIVNRIKWFGYKLNIGTDVKSGLSEAIEATPASG